MGAMLETLYGEMPIGPRPTVESLIMIFDPVEFIGTIETGDKALPVRFRAAVDDDGELQLSFQPIERGRAAFPFIPEQRVLESLQHFTLRGHTDDDWIFESETFHVSRWSRLPDHIEIAGYCGIAELSHPAKPGHHDACAWFYRKLSAFRPIWTKTDLGTVVLKGYKDDADQEPISLVAIQSEKQENDEWWQEVECHLTHIQRVLSFACGVYLLPVYEQRHRASRFTLRIAQRSRAPVPYLAPFRSLYMEEIFGCAILSFLDNADEVVRLDPAIRWLTAPAALAESQLMNAMSALECILASSNISQLYLDDKDAFDEIRKRTAKFLKNEKAPSKMASKLRELNRRPFKEKLVELLDRQPFPITDFPEDWLKGATDARNVIVHTGISPDLPADSASLLDHVVRVREIVIRLILAAIGFTGQYQSWLQHCADLSFPDCRRLDGGFAGPE
jgi:hypothetical protein